MTRIYLVRHGQTQWNIEKRFQGSGDSPLTTKGLEEIQLLKRDMRQIPLEAAYASPRNRAYQTAALIAEPHGIKVEKSEDFGEINLGKWEGKTHEEIKQQDPAFHHAFFYEPDTFQSVTESESMEVVQNRSYSALRDIVERHPGKHVLVVSHAITLRLLLLAFENRPIRDLWNVADVKQTSVTEVVMDKNKVQVIRKADRSHLDK